MSTDKLAPDWLCKSEQPIRSQVSKLTQLLTMTTTHKFPTQSVSDMLDMNFAETVADILQSCGDRLDDPTGAKYCIMYCIVLYIYIHIYIYIYPVNMYIFMYYVIYILYI